jgi:hypothetical protein
VMRTFSLGDTALSSADPVDSLDWPGVGEPALPPAGDDVADG